MTTIESVADGVRNVSEFAAVAPAVVHHPTTVVAVQECVRQANAAGQPVRVLSSGRNWGLGSAAGQQAGAAVIDLTGLQTIRELDLDRGHAVVEAGVTQAQLAEALAGSTRYLNCTASSARTSVVGNMMDRGVGVRGQRTADLLGLEVVVADGSCGSVGWWPHRRGAAANPWGLGPSVLQLFPQSAFGVATAATVRLCATPQVSTVLTFSAAEDQYGSMVATLRGIARDRLSSGVIKLFDGTSSDLYGATTPVITAHVCLDGAESVVRAQQVEVTARLAAMGAWELPAEQVLADPLRGAVTALYRGDVSRSEDIVRSALQASTEEADERGSGWMFLLPFVPFTEQDLTTARSLVQDAAGRHEVDIGTTANALSHDVVDLVVAIRFDRACESSTAAAHAAHDELHRALVEHGFHPYRLDISHCRADVVPADLESEVQQRIARALDPEGVFAANRYLTS